MPSDEQHFIHPDDVASIRDLRGDLDDAFVACKKRYTFGGLDGEESRERACGFVRAALKQVTMDIDPDIEKASAKELCGYLMKQKPTVLWSLAVMLVALVAGAFSLGVLCGLPSGRIRRHGPTGRLC